MKCFGFNPLFTSYQQGATESFSEFHDISTAPNQDMGRTHNFHAILKQTASMVYTHNPLMENIQRLFSGLPLTHFLILGSR